MDKKIVTIKQFAERHDFLTESAIRWILFKNEKGLEECLLRISNRIYIVEDAFMNFLVLTSNSYKEKRGLVGNTVSLEHNKGEIE